MATISPSKEVNKLYDKLLGYFNPKDQAYINRAFQYAYDGHNGRRLIRTIAHQMPTTMPFSLVRHRRRIGRMGGFSRPGTL